MVLNSTHTECFGPGLRVSQTIWSLGEESGLRIDLGTTILQMVVEAVMCVLFKGTTQNEKRIGSRTKPCRTTIKGSRGRVLVFCFVFCFV